MFILPSRMLVLITGTGDVSMQHPCESPTTHVNFENLKF